MKKNYLTSNKIKSISYSLKKNILALFILLFAAVGFAQQTATVITTSTSANWSMNFQNSGGPALTWLATGPSIPNIIGTGNNPNFDFSANDGSDITITITSADNFDFVTEMYASAKDIKSVDISNIENLIILELPNNDLTAIDLSSNVNLTDLVLSNNSLTAIDLSNNTLLEDVDIQINNLLTIDLSSNINLEKLNTSTNNLTSVNVTNNTNLTFLDLSTNELTSIDLSNNNLLAQINLFTNLLTTAAIGQVLTDVDAYGTGAFGYILDLRGNPGDIPASAIGALESLEGRNWIVRPPAIYDFGDAPNSYTTDRASGGPQHILGDGDLNIGLVFDDELNGFPGPDADGDNTNKVNDEDGVTVADLAGILTSTDSFSMDIDVTNNTSGSANLYAWIDFDGSGTFDPDEFTSVSVPNLGFGVATLNWTGILATGIVEGETFARFRITTDVLTSSQPGGIVNNGEVEDYKLSIGLDTDSDGVPDVSDLDADNDGILNTDEVGDSNGNGIDDMLELDSDGDGCLDVTEAGFTDGDGDGILGTSPVVVDANGLIVSDALGPIGDGYTTPADLDLNTIFDFQEAGAAATITTQPVDQDLIIGDVTFSTVAVADTYQWEESIDGGVTWLPLTDIGDYAGTATASLVVTNTDVSKLLYQYRVIVNNIAFACDPTTTSDVVTFITPDDTDLDGIFDIVDVDDDNDGILDSVEDNGTLDRDTDGDGIPDRIELDADNDGCFDVTEAGFTDGDGDGLLGTGPLTVDANGQITNDSLGPITDGYTAPNDLNGNTIPDFQEAGVAANITTQPVDQDLIIGVSTFSVVTDAVVGDATYQWEESIDGGTTWLAIVDGGDYAGATTAALSVTNADISKLTFRYRVLVSNIAFACDPITTSDEVGYITPLDTDLDGIFDIVDVDDDNDGILDTVEDNGIVDRDTDGDGTPDRLELDADNDGCFDVTEAGFTDGDGDGMLGSAPIVVDANGQITSGVDGYTPPNDLNANTIPDFQEAGVAANITTQPVDQIFVLAGTSTFSVVTDAVVGDASYQWEESIDNGVTWTALIDGGDYVGATAADLVITNNDFAKVSYLYRVLVSNVAFACDPISTSATATFITPGDFDKDGVFDIVDVDDDNDGILDVDEDNGIVDRDSDGDGLPDRTQLDSDNDGCFDVNEAGYTDVNGDGRLGVFPVVVDANGQVTSGTDGYTLPLPDADLSGTPDFQEAGAAAIITTQPINQNLIIGNVTFSVVASANTYQWQESTDAGATWVNLTDTGDYTGTTTADLIVTNTDVSKVTYQYQVIVSNNTYACDPTTTSSVVTFTTPNDFDNDGVFDIVDLDDDNDGILDTDEAGNTDPGTNPDRLNLDSDGDGCFDVTEAGFTDTDGDGILGSSPVVVDGSGQIVGAADGFTTPQDLDSSGTPDFQEAGTAATIATQPVDQNLIPGTSVTFSVVASADTYQWEISGDGGTTWAAIVDGGDFAGATTADLTISNITIAMNANMYHVIVSNIGFACDPTTTSTSASLINLTDTDGDTVPDIVDVDDDNDGILDTVEDNGIVDRDTDGDGIPDSLELDADNDGCYDVTEAGFTDNGMGMLGTSNPPVVNLVTGQVTSATNGYTAPNDLDGNGTPDFQEIGQDAFITSQPVDTDFVKDGSATFTVVASADTFTWEVSNDGTNWTTITDDATYSGATTASLTVSGLILNNYFDSYRVTVSNIAYACDSGETSLTATYNTLADNDGDGVFDIYDLDNDNDGILDSVEGMFTDSDLDGTPDRFELDSDGDGCSDVNEAGFTDGDGDGRLGNSPVTVDSDGIVTSGIDGYTTPNDLDGNGRFDFQQAGSPSEITSQPENQEISLGEDALFEVFGDATFYQWEVSEDMGTTWTVLTDGDAYNGVTTNRLRVYGARGRLESNLYRVLLTSPDFACDPNPELYSTAAMLSFNTEIIPNGFSPNGDSNNDTFIIPGLDQSPNFKMEVFDRWGNSVYKYSNNGNLSPLWWDGYSSGNMTLNKGERVPVGTYFYLIDFNDGNKTPAKGWVYINY